MLEKVSEYWSEVDSYFYSIYFLKKIGLKIKEVICYFFEYLEELLEVGMFVFDKVKEEYDLEYCVLEDFMRKYIVVVFFVYG